MIRRIHAAAMARQLGSHVTERLARHLRLLLLMRLRLQSARIQCRPLKVLDDSK